MLPCTCGQLLSWRSLSVQAARCVCVCYFRYSKAAQGFEQDVLCRPEDQIVDRIQDFIVALQGLVETIKVIPLGREQLRSVEEVGDGPRAQKTVSSVVREVEAHDTRSATGDRRSLHRGCGRASSQSLGRRGATASCGAQEMPDPPLASTGWAVERGSGLLRPPLPHGCCVGGQGGVGAAGGGEQEEGRQGGGVAQSVRGVPLEDVEEEVKEEEEKAPEVFLLQLLVGVWVSPVEYAAF